MPTCITIVPHLLHLLLLDNMSKQINADPLAPLEAAEPFESFQNATTTSPTVERPSYLPKDPDPSNPYRDRNERPLDTIRAAVAKEERDSVRQAKSNNGAGVGGRSGFANDRIPADPFVKAGRKRIGNPAPVDPIDLLDNTSGSARFHHDSPFDATMSPANNDPNRPAPVDAVRLTNAAALAQTPKGSVQDSLQEHVPLDGTGAVRNPGLPPSNKPWRTPGDGGMTIAGTAEHSSAGDNLFSEIGTVPSTASEMPMGAPVQVGAGDQQYSPESGEKKSGVGGIIGKMKRRLTGGKRPE